MKLRKLTIDFELQDRAGQGRSMLYEVSDYGLSIDTSGFDQNRTSHELSKEFNE